MDKETKGVLYVVGGIVLFIILIVVVCMATFPKYRVYKQNLAGQATLREAEWTKKVAVECAKAKMDSASLLAKAEIERAKGVAQANKIIGDSLKDNEGYLRYLWIDGLNDTTNRVIYVPTEGNLPILEAGKR